MSPGDEQRYGGDSGRSGDDFGGSGQTRTRLPEGGGDVYGGSRRPGRTSSRSLVTVVGVVVLLIAAIAFANRGGDDSSSGGGGGDDGKKAGAAPTAATGEHPVTGKSGGIPSGFGHDRQGAESAAANYAVALGSDGMFKADDRHRIVAAIYTAASSDKLRGPMDKAYSTDFLDKLGLDADGKAPQGSTFVSRTIPVGSRVTKYSADEAKIAVWYMGLIGMSGEASTDPVSSTWKTWTFDLKWAGGDWKIDSDSQKDGPAPVPGDVPAASSDQISKAVEEFGGYTYAR